MVKPAFFLLAPAWFASKMEEKTVIFSNEEMVYHRFHENFLYCSGIISGKVRPLTLQRKAQSVTLTKRFRHQAIITRSDGSHLSPFDIDDSVTLGIPVPSSNHQLIIL